MSIRFHGEPAEVRERGWKDGTKSNRSAFDFDFPFGVINEEHSCLLQ